MTLGAAASARSGLVAFSGGRVGRLAGGQRQKKENGGESFDHSEKLGKFFRIRQQEKGDL